MVGVGGFEPPTPCSQSRCASQAALYPDGKICYPLSKLNEWNSKMKLSISGLLALFFCLPSALANQAWETCIDRGDFLFIANSFTRSHRVTKTECLMRFVEIGGKGKKFEINLCDPQIHINEFGTLESTTYTRHYAGSAGCPAPLFGADFDLPKEQKGAKEFNAAREVIFGMKKAVKVAISPHSRPEDAEKVKNAKLLDSDAQMACMLLLTSEYLEKCVAFEARPRDLSAPATPPPPGVHPQTIVQ